MRILQAASVFLCLWAAAHAVAFDGHVAVQGPLTISIAPIEDVAEYAKPQTVAVTVKNSGEKSFAAHLRIGGLVDEWRAVGHTERTVELAPGKEARVEFQVAADKGALSALYPVHVYAKAELADGPLAVHAVQIFKSDFARAAQAAPGPQTLAANVVPARGALSLDPLRTQRVAWCYYDKPLVYMPVGWEGADAQSSAHFSRSTTSRGTMKASLMMHPPWKPGGGSIFAEYLLKLPETKPIKLVFSNAIRDQTAKEPPSDGVTFRVWAGEEKLFERHTDSKVWVDGEADLTKFAGKEILLRLESHPGPKRDTTCDSCFWGEPAVVAGDPPAQLTDADRQQLRDRARKAVESGSAAAPDEFVFKLDGGAVAACVLGTNGLADAALAFGQGTRCVVFDGLKISVLRNKFGAWPSQVMIRKVEAKKDLFGRVRITHHALLENEAFSLVADLWKDKAGLRVKLASPKRMTDIALGPADQQAPRVYYGHGYCIVEPKLFRAGFGGHNLSTSHVGFDFEQGVSLLTASDTPPDYLLVDPDQRLYALHTHMDATLTFVPGVQGAFDCAVKYRPLYDKKPAGGLKRKAGRFVFDIWGGKYAEIADTMRRMIAYGLTDSLLSVHVWQRWGYDYRLPDIFPPNPKYGSIEDMQEIARVCAERDIPWGLHDNYIDFYPDADDYTYEHICFTEDGRPIKAWLNESRDAQSYRWRPDRIMPFVRRNIALIKPALRPTHYFLDVFTSAGCFDFYDRQGNFHSSLETRKAWGESFAYIRDALGGNAPTTSEAGHDQLIGYLDGADCQHMLLTPSPSRFGNTLACKDWERVPWFDAVNHHRFSLHGVGYSDRYQGGRTRRDHGIESDDYISSEILEGHALMIDRGAFGRGAVRKYWLAQDFIRRIALDTIENVEFADGDIHRQIVAWKSGAKVFVNRGEKDWNVEGRLLPTYGYLAKIADIESSIERINGVIVEQSRGPSRFYVNARSFEPDPRLRIRPSADRVEYLGDRKFKLYVNWDVERPAPMDLTCFLHFDDPKIGKRNKLALTTGGAPTPPTTAWSGRIATGAEWRPETIPEDFTGAEYDITAGLYDPKSGKRYPLLGDEDGSTRYRIGTLVVEREAGKVKGVRLVKHEPAPEPPPRMNVAKKPIDFGPAVTEGAFRLEIKGKTVTVTPLPDSSAFTVTLNLEKLLGKPAQVRSVRAVAMDGAVLRDVKFDAAGASLKFGVQENEFAYQIQLE